jgi:hypothetical protein
LDVGYGARCVGGGPTVCRTMRSARRYLRDILIDRKVKRAYARTAGRVNYRRTL